MRLALIVVLCASVLAQVDDTPRAAPDIPKDVVWLDEGAPVPHSLRQYRGQVVLVDFWEYTCINCIRDFAVVKRWYAKYHRYGFEVLGVHYGEFRIGFNPGNVRRAAQRLRLPWPVIADVKGSTWQAFSSNVWPNRYLIDPKGSIVLQVEGEGNNARMEKQIRDLLAKQHPEVKSIALDPEEATFAPQCGAPTQETYVGKWHGRGAIENSGAYHGKDKKEDFRAAKPPRDGGVMLDGRWAVSEEAAVSGAPGVSAALRYHARSVYAVLSTNCTAPSLPAERSPKGGDAESVCSTPVRLYLLQDDKPLARADAGRDVQFDARGAYVDVAEPRMYDLVKNGAEDAPLKNRLPEHTLTLKAESPNFVLHSFTYGNNCQQNFE
jgi:glutathione peroxidase-family protein